MTLATRLRLLAFLSAILTVAVGESLHKANQFQQQIYHQLSHTTNIQVSIDSLRSQLWLHDEYQDEKSLQELNIRQAKLAELLAYDVEWSQKQQRILSNLNKLNTNIHALVFTQQTADPSLLSHEDKLSSQRLIKRKFSMNIEYMTEDIQRLHLETIARSKKTQQSLLISISVVVLILSTFVTLWSLLTLMRFKKGMGMLSKGVEQLAKGDLDSQIKILSADEFADMAYNFNQMKQSLKNLTIKKEHLKKEIAQQTSQLKAQQVKLAYLADHDELTGIMNRRAFLKQIEQAIDRVARRNEQAALLFIDLNKFKVINDSLGHDTGDTVLVTVAQRLAEHLRKTDFVGRYGGDEFIVWLDYIDSNEAIECKVEQLLSVIEEPIIVGQQTLSVGASIGISQYPLHGENCTSLITAADTAMYQAKQDPTKQYFFFEDIM